MKHSLHALLCAALLSLAACIPVEDFGANWDKGTADTALVGTWDDILPAGEKPKDSPGMAITCAESTCTLETLDPAEKMKKDYKPMTLRTLQAGDYKFVMVREEGKTTGDMVRYSIDKDVFRQSTPKPAKTAEFLKEKYPAAKNIHRPECKPDNCVFDSIKITTLDDETVKILSELPDTAEYWITEERYRKRP
ncbi:MAG: hypothetical protein ACAH80_17730 [Alphaproteobacteria bacterium]